MKNLTIENQFETAKAGLPKWSLTAAGFEKLLFALGGNDRERAGERYLLLRRNLVRFFEGRAVSEAEEAADEVCNRLARKLDRGEQFENIDQYSYGVARLLLMELYKERARRRRAFDALPQNAILPDERDDDKFRLERLDLTLSRLPAESREMILTYYQGDGHNKIENRRALAENLGIPQNALRSRAVRLREKLKKLIAGNLKKQTI